MLPDDITAPTLRWADTFARLELWDATAIRTMCAVIDGFSVVLDSNASESRRGPLRTILWSGEGAPRPPTMGFRYLQALRELVVQLDDECPEAAESFKAKLSELSTRNDFPRELKPQLLGESSA